MKPKEEIIKKIEKMLEEEEKLIISLKFFLYGIIFSLVGSVLSFYIYDLSKRTNLYLEFAIASAILTATFGLLIYFDFKRRMDRFNSLKWKRFLYEEKLKRER